MTDPVGTHRVAEKLIEQAAKENSDQNQDAHASDQARFKDAMEGMQATDASTPTQAPKAAEENLEPTSPGDAILRGMDKMRSDVGDMDDEVKAITDKETVSPQDLLKVQMQVGQTMIKEQFADQAVSKADQDVNTLVKGQ